MRVNARFHYGHGREFLRYWLDDPLMMYTCAYWKEGTGTLEEAERNKVDHVSRKLRLRSGETVADVGCGRFMFHAREHYGVRPVGYNTTTEQVAELRAQIEEQGLQEEMQVYDECMQCR